MYQTARGRTQKQRKDGQLQTLLIAFLDGSLFLKKESVPLPASDSTLPPKGDDVKLPSPFLTCSKGGLHGLHRDLSPTPQKHASHRPATSFKRPTQTCHIAERCCKLGFFVRPVIYGSPIPCFWKLTPTGIGLLRALLFYGPLTTALVARLVFPIEESRQGDSERPNSEDSTSKLVTGDRCTSSSWIVGDGVHQRWRV